MTLLDLLIGFGFVLWLAAVIDEAVERHHKGTP